jgi:hemolysin-activating ACP:hemolysin acyltransferase
MDMRCSTNTWFGGDLFYFIKFFAYFGSSSKNNHEPFFKNKNKNWWCCVIGYPKPLFL